MLMPVSIATEGADRGGAGNIHRGNVRFDLAALEAIGDPVRATGLRRRFRSDHFNCPSLWSSETQTRLVSWYLVAILDWKGDRSERVQESWPAC